MITDKDVADKKNEVTMLRLERDEMLIRRQLDRAKPKSELTDASALREANATIHNAKTYIDDLEAELSNCKSAIGMKNGVINNNVEHLERVYNQLHGFQDDVYEKNNTIDELTEQRDSEYETAKALRRVIDGIEQDVTKYKTTIDEPNETISDLRMAASDMLDTINECARGEAEDSRVLMQVVEALREWQGDPFNPRHMIKRMRHIAKDYLAAPGSQVVTLKTPSMGTRVVSKNEETPIIYGGKMEAVRMLIECENDWILHTDGEATEVRQQKGTINKLNALLADEKMTLAAYRSNPLSDQVADRDNRIEQLMVLNGALRIDIELAHNLSRDHIANQAGIIEGLRSRMTGARIIIDNQATTIEELRKDLDARNTVIKDFKAIEQKETDRLHETIDELNSMYCDVCGKLERIENISKKARTFGDVINRVSANHIAIDEITKIIQEE